MHNCDLCLHNQQDEYGDYYCDVQLDEDEYARYLARRNPACPYCQQGKKIDALVNSFGYSAL